MLRDKPEEYWVRREKLKKLREAGIEPYVYKFEPTHKIKTVIEKFDELKKERIILAGRVISKRVFGKLIFSHIRDETGDIQIACEKNTTRFSNGDPSRGIEMVKKFVDIGDIVGVEGNLFLTRTGEKTLLAENLKILSKGLLPLPEKWHGLKDKELRYRQRYLDLIFNLPSREIARRRIQIIDAIRDFFKDRGFLEFDTPILQPIYGGASARPFETFSNALNIPLYLRISDELYLKRLLVGGFERVFEFSRDFRNEGIDRLHYPEFTILEAYAAYWDYRDMMNLVEELLLEIGRKVFKSEKIKYQGMEISLNPPYPRISFISKLKEKIGADPLELSEKSLRGKASSMGIEGAERMPRNKLLDKLFDKLIAPELISPTFVIDYPIELSPLAKRHRENPKLVERFELFMFGIELANAFTELNDPLDQRERFIKQLEFREEGDLDIPAHIDEDFLTALEYGMPPAGGIGIGIDRLVMIFLDQPSIRDVILFPQLRTRE
jgi:lysyl-tRNA synthetase class 2